MIATTRTGLVPTPKKNFHLLKKKQKNFEKRLPVKFEASPMRLSLRPLDGLLNPFAKGCSVLCNHPAPTAVKEAINQMKISLAVEGRNAQLSKERLVSEKLLQMQPHHHQHEVDNIPEDLFRRYADTDSRPMTPTPTVTSVHTRTSAGSFLNRRCITPEWGKNEVIKRQKIILDLRRSHSQETLFWKPNSDITLRGQELDKKPKSAGANEEKKSRQQKPDEQHPKSCAGIENQTIPVEYHHEETKKIPIACINEHEIDDEDVRRGKKRKKIKSAVTTTTFHLSEDPETQVATLGPDSLNPSTRPSLIPNSVSLLPHKDPPESEPVLLKGSFLTDEAFVALKSKLDVDIIENTFDKYLNRALQEAFKYMPPKPNPIFKGTEDLNLFLTGQDSKMPRKFSKSATRFEVPLDLALLQAMTPWDYFSNHVSVSQQRKQLYKRVFLKYLNKTEDTDLEQLPVYSINETDADALKQLRSEYVERTIKWQCLPKALEDVLEFQGTEKNVKEILRILEYDQQKNPRPIIFRTWCGIVSFAERLAVADSNCSDSCNELEKADFSSMEQIIDLFTVSAHLREVFDIIRRTHNTIA